MTWTPTYPPYTPWHIERLGARLRCTENGRLRITEQLNIRIIEFIAHPTWSKEYANHTTWTME